MHGLLPEPQPLLGNPKYVKVQSLGQGSFGFVELARNTQTQEPVAVKCLKRSELNKYVEAEIVNHSLLRHPHIIQFKEVFLTSDYICIAMEFANGGSLFSYVQKQGKLREAVARWFFQQLVIGVDYCHKRGVYNRDIKLENTLLQMQPGRPLPLLKICDFGYSKAEVKSAPKSKVGTLTYMAPEVLINQQDRYDGKAADIWSCGVMLYVMLFGRYPFGSTSGEDLATANDIIDMLEQMVNQRYAVPLGVDISPGCQGILRGMLHPDPQRRISLEQMFADPWFLSNLPPEAVTMNRSYVAAATQRLPNRQSPEDIQLLIHRARELDVVPEEHPM